MSWQDIYKSKLVSVENAAKKIESGDKIWFGACSAAPIQILEALADRAEELENVDLVSAMALYPFKFLQSPEFIGKLNYHTIFYGPFERKFYKVGNVDINSVHFAKAYLAIRDVFKVDTLLADVSEPDEDGYMYYGVTGVAWNGVVAEHAKKKIVQVNKNQPKVNGTKNRIHVSEVDCICEYDHPLLELSQPPTKEIDRKIASYIIPLIPDGATLQVGLGGIANAVAYGLENKKNLSVHTEMLTDSMVYLAKKGIINGRILAGFGLGSKELYDYVAEGKVELAPIEAVNDPYIAGKNDDFMSINSTLMMDLTGQVCSESIGFSQFSCTGGQLDYVRAAGISKGGKSFLCLSSTVKNKDGSIGSTITVTLPKGQAVTTPRSDVMYVVTEYGIADLYNRPIKERVEAMISIAHPDFREKLRQEAIDSRLIVK
ncbi:acetyl-CoA hydrolase/transferase C-terminal domain-containing protein [Clostridium sp.]|uniref:acetyl-CoA hydrolase/transferase family protein n=1 Tax=Clostridium sp. TaxID=1506 RepID=UPI001A55E63F|nr:acetyl-CoA hydrolase/transferase C-terminal domain-containing protein [Clostridium sp.]MBK5242781.1 4-hydroxybutyrate CoA-transferase [Clostridium sp.]